MFPDRLRQMRALLNDPGYQRMMELARDSNYQQQTGLSTAVVDNPAMRRMRESLCQSSSPEANESPEIKQRIRARVRVRYGKVSIHQAQGRSETPWGPRPYAPETAPLDPKTTGRSFVA